MAGTGRPLVRIEGKRDVLDGDLLQSLRLVQWLVFKQSSEPSVKVLERPSQSPDWNLTEHL